MTKYVYLCFMKTKGLPMSEEESKKWWAEHDKLCEKHKVKLLASGNPFGTVEEQVFVYGTDIHLDAFQAFRTPVTSIEPRPIAYTRTIQVLCHSRA